ncbi:GNAT family N-acetyltransferase [Streptomyces sp. NBC_01481]|uniref:GNAT family N-acetyltransferase n=1 Tax=Streptomyces sp. NBC_01481 TaxID=2975869 RepID=UPI00224D865A|nr:GNAT family N-acetyltransferase [Streptomyces sp. NBC_01481]MCX4586353.1 GNAT family N-acetyltransferase [Streptomyces sp. NBC_01481]
MPSLVAPAIPVGALAASGQPTLPIEGGALLRPWRIADAEAVAEAFQDPEIQRWHVRRADSVEEAREWIEGWRSSWHSESGGHWAVAGVDGDRLLGRVSLKSLDLADGKAEVAYWMVPAARGRGVCTCAVMTLTRWALEHGRFHRLELEHSTGNQASCRVAVKAGFEEEGVRRGAALHADGWHDMHLHACVWQG